MAKWRLMRGWSEAELASALGAAASLRRNFEPVERMDPSTGWNISRSFALIAREKPGPPAETFGELWHAISHFRHSDPRIVVGHFDPRTPLSGRRVLLELKAVRLHFLCPAVIVGMEEATDGARMRRAFALDTLEGHIERGREFFVLEKELDSGAIHFRIEARWQEGDFPGQWAHLGFHLVGRRYQRAWHRLAHVRLRRIAAHRAPEEPPSGKLEHSGDSMRTEPISFFFGKRRVGRWRVGVEREQEEMRRIGYLRAAGLGALSGLRSFGPPAMLAAQRHGRSSPAVANGLVALAGMEMVADKFPGLPPRTQPPSLAARMLSGAVAGGAMGSRGTRIGPALLGAGAALASSFLALKLRRLAMERSPTWGWAAALAEDSLVLLAGGRLARA